MAVPGALPNNCEAFGYWVLIEIMTSGTDLKPVQGQMVIGEVVQVGWLVEGLNVGDILLVDATGARTFIQDDISYAAILYNAIILRYTPLV